MKKYVVCLLFLFFVFACKSNIKNDSEPLSPSKPKEVLQGFVSITLPESGIVGKNPSYKTPI